MNNIYNHKNKIKNNKITTKLRKTKERAKINTYFRLNLMITFRYLYIALYLLYILISIYLFIYIFLYLYFIICYCFEKKTFIICHI